MAFIVEEGEIPITHRVERHGADWYGIDNLSPRLVREMALRPSGSMTCMWRDELRSYTWEREQ